MAYREEEARRLVIEAGHRLLESGLIARTWGNISARLSPTQFVVTPSGLAYDTLRPEQLVIVNIADCSTAGPGKPSSEKGVHADSYRLRGEVDFVIHTHQFYASCVGLSGRTLPAAPFETALGESVPCAAYGLSSTKKLRENVAAAIAAYPGSRAILMRRHGALCLGRSYEDAFAAVDALEKAAQAEYDRLVPPQTAPRAAPLGESVREGGVFALTLGGNVRRYYVDRVPAAACPAAHIHAALYRAGSARYILHEASPDVTAYSALGAPMRPLLDDLAQIAGATLHCAESGDAALARAARGCSAVFVRGQGALCLGGERGDAEAVAMILRKACAAERYAAQCPGCTRLTLADAALQRLVYVSKYSRQKAKG